MKERVTLRISLLSDISFANDDGGTLGYALAMQYLKLL